MPLRHWLVSVLILALFGLKLAEGAFQIESWPLSNVPMFATYVPMAVTPRRILLRGRTDGGWFDVLPSQVGLTDDEFIRRFEGNLSRVPLVCAELGNIYNASRPTGALRALEAHVVAVPRPGVPMTYGDVVVACPLAPRG
jgi:hypothetical protein